MTIFVGIFHLTGILDMESTPILGIIVYGAIAIGGGLLVNKRMGRVCCSGPDCQAAASTASSTAS